MANKAHLVVDGSGYGRESAAWLTPGGWFFMFEDGDVRSTGGYIAYFSTAGKCRQILSSRIDILRPVAGMLPCPELVDYLEELRLWLSDFAPDTRLLADFSELDELLMSIGRRDETPDQEQWRAGAGAVYLLPADAGETYHAYAAFNVSQWMKAVAAGRWDQLEDGLRYIGIADDVWGDTDQGKGIVIGYEEEAVMEYEDDSSADGPEARRLSPDEFLKRVGG